MDPRKKNGSRMHVWMDSGNIMYGGALVYNFIFLGGW